MKLSQKKCSWLSGILILSLSFISVAFLACNKEADDQDVKINTTVSKSVMNRSINAFGTGETLECAQAQCFLSLLIDLIVPIQNAINDPIGPNQEVEWSQGPDIPDSPSDDRPPNIIVILADDMGFNDVSYYNGGAADGTLQTPGIDSIATQGVAFNNGYASHATCAPSRAAVLTGRYPTRFGYEYTPMVDSQATIVDLLDKCRTDPYPTLIDMNIANALPPFEELGVPPSEVTIAEKLKEAGYHTVHIGKWHCGRDNGMAPEDQGFDEALNMTGMLYLPEDSPDVVNAKCDFSPIDSMVWGTARYASQYNGGPWFEPNGYLTDYYTDEAVKVIEANKNRPFLLYLAHWGIHNPLQTKKEDYDALSHIKDHRLRVYAAMIRALDRGVGRVMDALVDNGIDNNTLVIFTSDNGGAGYIGLPDVNHPYRGWKCTFFEGGTHVPYFMRWPKMISGGMTYDHPVSHTDIFATAAAAAGVSLPDDRTIDGVDLLPYVTGVNPDEPHDTLFWRNGYYQVVLSDGWKMSVSDMPDKIWLYDLTVDPTETMNLADTNALKVEELQGPLDTHNADQVDPMWDSFIEAPFMIDKTSAEEMLETDEIIYWLN